MHVRAPARTRIERNRATVIFQAIEDNIRTRRIPAKDLQVALSSMISGLLATRTYNLAFTDGGIDRGK